MVRVPVITRRFISAISCGLLCWACSNTTEPSQRITLSIAPQPDVIVVGITVPLTVTDKSTGANVQVVWSTSDPMVAVVTLGQLRGVHAGLATIGATYDGSDATFSVKVVPDFSGAYRGNMVIVDCMEAAVIGSCQAALGPVPFGANWTQTKDVVTGTVTTCCSLGPVQGRIDNAGVLAITGTLQSVLPGGNQLFTDLDQWSTYLNDAGTQLFGSFNMRFRDGSVLRATERAELRGIDRVP